MIFEAEERRQEAKKRREEEEEEASSSRMMVGGGPFRRQGLPVNVVVDRRGDLYIFLGRLAATQAVGELLELRLPHLRRMHATVVETPLSKEDTKAVMKQLAVTWSENEDSQGWVNEAWRSSE